MTKDQPGIVIVLTGSTEDSDCIDKGLAEDSNCIDKRSAEDSDCDEKGLSKDSVKAVTDD